MAEKSKKILYIITKSVWGGAGRYTYDLASSFSQNFNVAVAAGGHGIMAEKILRAKIPYFEIKGFQRNVSLFKDVLAFFEVLFVIFRTKPDIIHVSSAKAGGIAGVAILLYKIARKFQKSNSKIQAIFTAHGWTFNEKRPGWQIFLIKFFSKITCLFYDRIICVSDFDKDAAIKNKIADSKKFSTIYNGLNLEDYSFLEKLDARNKLGIESNKYTIGTIGEFTKNKGYGYLIKAIKEVPDVLLIIIAWGEEENSIKKEISDLNLSDRVIIVDNLFNAGNYLRAFDLFVLPSTKEGLPYVILEAGTAGVPVVASSVGGIPEMVKDGETGLLTVPADEKSLAEKIKIALKNKDKLAKMAIDFRKIIDNKFSLEKMLGATLSVYEKEPGASGQP